MAESDFWQALSDTIHRSVNLRIVTMVGDAVVNGTLERLEVGAPAASAGSVVTDINLVGGDITHIFSDKLLGTDYADLRSAHQEAVKRAQDIVERNVNILAHCLLRPPVRFARLEIRIFSLRVKMLPDCPSEFQSLFRTGKARSDRGIGANQTKAVKLETKWS